MSKQNILILTQLFPNEYNKTIGTFVFEQCKALSKYYNITVLTTYSLSPRYIFRNKQTKFKEINGFKVHYMKINNFFYDILIFLKIINRYTLSYLVKRNIGKKLIKKAEYLNKNNSFKFVHGHEVYIGDEAPNIGSKLNIPSYVTIHSLYEYHIYNFGERVMSLVLKNLSKNTNLISVSNIAVNGYRKKLKDKKITIIPNGIKINEPIVSPPEKWKKIINNQISFCSIGFFDPNKKIELAIEACNTLNKEKFNFIYLIIGKGPMEEYYKKIIKKYNLQRKIHIVGEVKPKEVKGFINLCDFLVHPSIFDSFSMVALEAMSLAKPVILTKNAGITEYIKNNNEALIVNPNDKFDLYKNIKKLIISSNQRIVMGKKSYQTAKKFDQDLIVKELLKLYDYTNGYTN